MKLPTLLVLVASIAVGAMPLQPAAAQSARPGPGATLYDDAKGYGTTFRTWAPNADSVSVDVSDHPLVVELGAVYTV